MRHFWLVLLAATLSFGQQARIRVDTERAIGTVDPLLFGNFTEHLGRCIYGGIFEEGSPLADAEGFRKDVMEATRGLGVTMLRWPGGNFVSGYNWMDGIGPRDQRPARRDGAWGALESNRFGTDEFLRYCERLGVEPYICINAGLGSVEDARQWVEYCNEPGKTRLADVRRKNGREKPWGVKYWGLGNELDGPWQLGHKDAATYAKFALEAGKAMRRADNSIKLIASGSSNFSPGSDWIGWNRTVLETLKSEIDYISLHTYIGNPENNFERFLAASRAIDRRIEVVKGLIEAAQETQRNPRPIYIAYDEWNVWYRARSGGTESDTAKTGLEEKYNYEDALAMGMFLNSFIRHADVVKMANLAQLVNVIAPIFTDKNGMYLQTIYFPIAEYAKQKNRVAVDATVRGPEYKPDSGRALGYLDVSATYDAKARVVTLNVLNKSEKMDIATEIAAVEGTWAREAGVWELQNADLKAAHTFGDDKRVRPVVRKATLEGTGRALKYTFPKHSLTLVTLKME
jgi:alpha-N-arabinofuranosidase